MIFSKVENGEIVSTNLIFDIIKQQHPNVSFPTTNLINSLLDFGYYETIYNNDNYDMLQILVQQTPYISDNKVIINNIAQDLSLVDAKNVMKQKLLEIRQKKEIAGITINGMSIATQDEDVNKIQGAFQALSEGFVPSISFRTADGNFVNVDLALITVIGTCLSQYKVSCFDRHSSLSTNIDNCTTLAELRVLIPDIDSGWPSQIFTV